MSPLLTRWIVSAADAAGLRMSRGGPMVFDVTRGDGRRASLFVAGDFDDRGALISLRSEDREALPVHPHGVSVDGPKHTLRVAPGSAAQPFEQVLEQLEEKAGGPFNVGVSDRLFTFSGHCTFQEAPFVFAALFDCWTLAQAWQRDDVEPRFPRLRDDLPGVPIDTPDPAPEEATTGSSKWQAAPPPPVEQRLLDWTRKSLTHTDAVAERRGNGVEVRFDNPPSAITVRPDARGRTVLVRAELSGDERAGAALKLKPELGWVGQLLALFETPIDDRELDAAYLVKGNDAGVQFAQHHRAQLLALAPFGLQLDLGDGRLTLSARVHRSQASVKRCLQHVALLLEQAQARAHPDIGR